MFNIFNSLSNKDKKSYTGTTISFNTLIEKIRSNNPEVLEARNHGKGTTEYNQIKLNNIPCFFANCYTEKNNRGAKYFTSTGFIFLDIDSFSSHSESSIFKDAIINNPIYRPFIAACWLSTSNLGLSILVKVNPKKCNRFRFKQYWDKLNELFNNRIDSRTNDFKRLCILSSDLDIYVNEDAVEFDSIYSIEYESSLHYKTPIPLSEFTDLNKPVVYKEGLDVLNVDFYKYRNNKVKIGYRNSTIGAISMQLIYLNPEATKEQLLAGLMSFNRCYCIEPLPEKEVAEILVNNMNKELDITKYLYKKYVFFHPDCKIPKPIKQQIRGEAMSNLTAELIKDSIKVLVSQSKPVTVANVCELTLLSKTTVYRHLNTNDTFSQDHIYPYTGYNMQQWEKVSSLSETGQRIYEALEDLQDNVNRITQDRVAEYMGISIITVKRNWLPCFKELVKVYNNSLKTSIAAPVSVVVPEVVVESIVEPEASTEEISVDYSSIRLLSAYRTEQDFDNMVTRLENSRLYCCIV